MHDLSAAAGGPVTLSDVPESELLQWQTLGFTHIWLMGVWTVGPRARREALLDPNLRAAYSKAIPDWTEADVAGSPYAVAGYTVSSSLGGEAALARFRSRLHSRGMKLLLDFIPNHVGLDHPWVTSNPERLVHSHKPRAGTFQEATSRGTLWLAHGRDPVFPPWSDTAQVDVRNPESWTALLAILQRLTTICDGVRCDMAMLLLSDIFERTWADFLPETPPASGEVWQYLIDNVEATHPDFLFLAEAYWGTEPRLRQLGFDLVYNKPLLDLLVTGNMSKLCDYIAQTRHLDASVHFLENHDEPRAATHLPTALHSAAAALILSLPGVPLLHEGQLTGMRRHIPVQLGRRAQETSVQNIVLIYKTLLSTLKKTLLPARAPEVSSNPPCVIARWPDLDQAETLIAINLSAEPAFCRIPLSARSMQVTRLYPSNHDPAPHNSFEPGNLAVTLPAWGHTILQVHRIRP